MHSPDRGHQHKLPRARGPRPGGYEHSSLKGQCMARFRVNRGMTYRENDISLLQLLGGRRHGERQSYRHGEAVDDIGFHGSC